MSKKNTLIKTFEKVVNDIMDHYDDYTEAEKQEIKKFYEYAINLNSKLEHYDKKKNIFEKFVDAFLNFFGGEK